MDSRNDKLNNGQKTIKAPPKFHDAQGNEWTIKLTLGLIESVQERCGIDLVPDDNDITSVAGLVFNPRKLGAVLWECCRKQAESEGVTREAYFDLLDEDALANGWNALIESILFFIQSRSPKVAESMRLAIEAQMRLIEAGAEQMQKAIQSEVTQKGISDAMDQIGRQMQADLSKALAESATN